MIDLGKEAIYSGIDWSLTGKYLEKHTLAVSNSVFTLLHSFSVLGRVEWDKLRLRFIVNFEP